jgi:ribonuclease HII
MSTKIVIGVDEAGYGPSMGPLVIVATAWRIPAELNVEALGRLLEPELQAAPITTPVRHIPIGDSKKIHRGKFAWESLCCGADWLTAMEFGSDSSLWCSAPRLANSDWQRVTLVPWYASLKSNGIHPIPDWFDEGCRRAADQKLKTLGIDLLGLSARLFDEPEFNRLVEHFGNKSTLLSENSLSLVRTLADEVSQPGATVEIYCDKHGGRNHYQPLLIHTFDDVWFNIIEQGRERSIYSAEWKERFVNIRFSVGGDSWFPSSAASIIAKWLRELCMFSLNRYWQERSSVTLRPTAGYYVDAVRFSQEIAPLISQEGFARHQWWRTV